jgi:fucose permease
MYTELKLPVSLEAVANAVITAGTVFSSLNAVKLIKKFGTYRIVLISTMLTACSISGYGLSHNFYFILLLSIPLGIGAGAVDTALNNYLAIHYSASHMNWLHCFWGIGAMTGPLLMSVFINRQLGWRYGYFAIGIAQMIIVVILLLSVPAWKAQGEVNAVDEPTVIKLPDLLKVKGVKLAMLIFLSYCATEYTIVCWGSTYLVRSREVSSAVAASWISMYYLGITCGRMLCGFFALKISNRKLISIGLNTVMLGAVILMLPLPSFAALIGLAFVGFGCAPVFPGMISETPKRFGKSLSQAVISIEMTSAYTGALILPVLFGFPASYISMSIMPYFIAFLVITIKILNSLLNKMKSI